VAVFDGKMRSFLCNFFVPQHTYIPHTDVYIIQLTLYGSITVAAVYGAYCLQPTAQSDLELESHSKQECMCKFF